MAKAFGPHCQGQTLLGMLAPPPTSSPSPLEDGWKRKWRGTLLSYVSLPTFSYTLFNFPRNIVQQQVNLSKLAKDGHVGTY